MGWRAMRKGEVGFWFLERYLELMCFVVLVPGGFSR